MSAFGKVIFRLDEPKDWSAKVRHLRLTGWCVAEEGPPLVAIRAQLGGKIFAGQFHCDRPDVVAHLADFAPPLRCGFTIHVEVPHGKQRLEVRVARGDVKWQKVFARDVAGPLRVSAAERKLRRAEQAAQPGTGGSALFSRFDFWLDEPKDWTLRVRHLRISGWCLAMSGAEVSAVRARLRRKTFAAVYGIVRPDVAVAVQDKNSALRSGFNLDLIVPWGSSQLTLEARSREGEWEPFYTREITGPLFWSRHGRVEDIGPYADWIYLHDRLTRADKMRIRRQIRTFTRQHRFSVLLPVYNTDAIWLQRAIDSVRDQLYPHWELCIVDDASPAPHVWPLLQRAAQRDRRIKILRRETNGHISAASNDALNLATGDYVALLDHDDELAPTALYFAAYELNRRPDLQLLYSDEDKLNLEGERCDPYFKSDWNPDLLTSQNYISHLSIYATALVRKVGGFRVGLEGSQDYDLILRCVERITAAQICHIPHVLYHWRLSPQSTSASAAAKPYAHTAAVRAVQEHVDRGPSAGRVAREYAEFLRVAYAAPPDHPLVSIIIPTRDRAGLLRRCIASIRAKTEGVNYEIIVLDNESHEPETLAYFAELAQIETIEVVASPGAFNFSKLNNLGAARARGSFVAFLNNDLEVINRDWLCEMLSHAARPGIGAVGARLWYPDGTLQHGGVLLGLGGVANHAHLLLRQEHGYFARARLTQNFSAVTGACLVMRRGIFQEIGGFDETNLPVAFNDVDLCLRLRERDLRIVWTPQAELVHHESASRGFDDTEEKQQRFQREIAYMHERWGDLLVADPYYNPNLSLSIDQQFKLAFPPRAVKPWKDA